MPRVKKKKENNPSPRAKPVPRARRSSTLRPLPSSRESFGNGNGRVVLPRRRSPVFRGIFWIDEGEREADPAPRLADELFRHDLPGRN